MKNFIYCMKQIFPFAYWTKYKTPDDNKYHIAIWRQWFGKPFSTLHFEINSYDGENFVQTLTDEMSIHTKNNAHTDKQKTMSEKARSHK